MHLLKCFSCWQTTDVCDCPFITPPPDSLRLKFNVPVRGVVQMPSSGVDVRPDTAATDSGDRPRASAADLPQATEKPRDKERLVECRIDGSHTDTVRVVDEQRAIATHVPSGDHGLSSRPPSAAGVVSPVVFAGVEHRIGGDSRDDDTSTEARHRRRGHSPARASGSTRERRKQHRPSMASNNRERNAEARTAASAETNATEEIQRRKRDALNRVSAAEEKLLKIKAAELRLSKKVAQREVKQARESLVVFASSDSSDTDSDSPAPARTAPQRTITHDECEGAKKARQERWGLTAEDLRSNAASNRRARAATKAQGNRRHRRRNRSRCGECRRQRARERNNTDYDARLEAYMQEPNVEPGGATETQQEEDEEEVTHVTEEEPRGSKVINPSTKYRHLG